MRFPFLAFLLFIKEYTKQILHVGLDKYVNTTVMGMKGLLNLGQTDGLNSIIQLYAHLPFIRDYFFSDKHSSMHCFLRSNTTNREFPTCFSCCFSELMKELYADNNNTFVNPKDIFHFVLTSLLQRQPLSNVTFRNYLYIFINKLGMDYLNLS